MGVSKVRSVLFLLIIWRLCSVFIVQTSHVPDEYWQSLEVAHKLSFGYGYLTWEWNSKIRSYIYPYTISILYRLLHLLHFDHVAILINLPRCFQALLAAYADYRFYIWTKDKWSVFSLSINWYWYYCASRTLINSLETSLTIIALSIFPWRDKDNNFHFLWIVGFLFMMRPTSAIIWLPLCLYHFCTRSSNVFTLIKNYTLIGAVCLSISIFIDSLCYEEFVITPWTFLEINVLKKVSESYGVEYPFWYFTSGLPVLLGLDYPRFVQSVWRICTRWRQFHREMILLITVVWTIFLYSCLAHKEFRFILPLLPMIIYITNSRLIEKRRLSEFKRKLFIALFVLSNLIPGLYFSLIHQRGSLDTMRTIRHNLTNNENADILFLTPCHATPLYSHLHKNVSVRFLKCEPNLENETEYVEEAQRFFAEPEANNERMDEICKLLDKLTLRNLELMEEKIQANIQMENLLRDGHIELAKARYIRGKESIGQLQLPTEGEEVTSLFELQTVISEKDNVPQFDISLKQSSDTQQDIQDPIKRFGVLVPQNLRNAQKRFQESLYIAMKTVNISSVLLSIQNEFQSLLTAKKKLCEENSKINNQVK